MVIIDRGRIAAEGTPDSLRQAFVGNPGVRVTVKDAPADALEVLQRIGGVTAVEPGSAGAGSFLLQCARAADPREQVFLAAVERRWVLLELAMERASLEDVFVRLTTRDLPGQAEHGDEQPRAASEVPS